MFRLASFIALLGFIALWPQGASAQRAISTLGGTLAHACFENARGEINNDTAPCDRALQANTDTRRDRLATYVNRGIIRNRQGNYAGAIEDFDIALDGNDRLAEAYLNRGNSAFFQGRVDAALADYEKAIGLDVKQPYAAWYNIGLALEVKKDIPGALGAFRKSLEIDPDFAPAQRKIAELEQA